MEKTTRDALTVYMMQFVNVDSDAAFYPDGTLTEKAIRQALNLLVDEADFKTSVMTRQIFQLCGAFLPAFRLNLFRLSGVW